MAVLDWIIGAAVFAACAWTVVHAPGIFIEQGATRIPSRAERKAWPKRALPRFWQVMLLRAVFLAVVAYIAIRLKPPGEAWAATNRVIAVALALIIADTLCDISGRTIRWFRP